MTNLARLYAVQNAAGCILYCQKMKEVFAYVTEDLGCSCTSTDEAFHEELDGNLTDHLEFLTFFYIDKDIRLIAMIYIPSVRFKKPLNTNG